MGEVFLSECHPESRAAQCGEILHEALEFLVIEQVALARTDVGVGEGAVYLEILCLDPFPFLPVFPFLGDFADIDFRIEIGGEGFAVVAGVAVHDVEVTHLGEMVLGGVSHEYGGDSGAAAEDGRQAGLFEAIAVGPLP